MPPDRALVLGLVLMLSFNGGMMGFACRVRLLQFLHVELDAHSQGQGGS